MARKRRLDEELVAQGFFATCDEALRAVLAGRVSCRDRRLSSPGEQVERGLYLHVRGEKGYVSRGGLKLERALDAFSIDPGGKDCLDVGCSTGGFTDCLLAHGAAHIIAVDVGYAQFAWELRNDSRVELLERTNIVDLAVPDRLGTVDLAVCDVSFTSVATVLPAVRALLRNGGSFIALVKPQFEVPRGDVGEGGIVRDEALRRAALEKVRSAFIAQGLQILGSCESPIAGAKGNIEYLLAGRACDARDGGTGHLSRS